MSLYSTFPQQKKKEEDLATSGDWTKESSKIDTYTKEIERGLGPPLVSSAQPGVWL